ncbi:MAG TPA: DUF1775 domain-containing protein [Gaiellaceae bacterium]|nr:DUF1775 domain-containing protein [Gaiellaceae bacterium]
MNLPLQRGLRLPAAALLAAPAALAAAPAASAHAHVSPPVALARAGQLFTLDVPTEKEGLTTTKVVLTVPPGFSIDSFVPAAGWRREVQKAGSGEDAAVQRVTWTGGSVPAEEVAHFAFLGRPGSSRTYAFSVEQTYSDGSVVDWSGPESSDAPAPTIEAKGSLGGGGGSTLGLVGIVVGGVGVLIGVLALVARSGRQLA